MWSTDEIEALRRKEAEDAERISGSLRERSSALAHLARRGLGEAARRREANRAAGPVHVRVPGDARVRHVLPLHGSRQGPKSGPPRVPADASAPVAARRP